MLFGQDRNQMRQVFIDAWKKHTGKQVLEPLERIIANIVTMHPEYHKVLENEDSALEKEYLPDMGESNPFLHMGLHISIHEQVSINQPTGITDIYNALLAKHQDPHLVEHLIMDCLAEMIWEAQRNNAMPNEAKYLECLKSLER